VNTYFQGLKLRFGEKVDLTLFKQVISGNDSNEKQQTVVPIRKKRTVRKTKKKAAEKKA